MSALKLIAAGTIGIIVGYGLGVFQENFRYSIIYHEAQKGDAEAQKIIDEFETVGSKIEEIFTN